MCPTHNYHCRLAFLKHFFFLNNFLTELIHNCGLAFAKQIFKHCFYKSISVDVCSLCTILSLSITQVTVEPCFLSHTVVNINKN